MTDGTLRDHIAQALIAWTYRNGEPKYAALRRDETVRANAYSRADAVLAALPTLLTRSLAAQAAGDASGGFTGISLAGRWECGNCGATGDGWYDPEDGLVLHDENGQPFTPEDHDCDEAQP